MFGWVAAARNALTLTVAASYLSIPTLRKLEADCRAGDPQDRLGRETIAGMLDIAVSESTSASPERVLAAATDLSDDRVKVWPNSKPQAFEVHDQGAGFAEVTEGFRPPFGHVWERSRYEWEPGEVRQTVIASNVLAPGSTWTLRASPSAAGSTVEMQLRREFLGTGKGRTASVINHLGGRRMWGWYLRKALAEVERRAT